LSVLTEHPCGTLVETGRHHGVSTEMFALLLPNTTIYSIDLHPTPQAAARLAPYPNVKLIDDCTFETAATFPDSSIDCVYLDTGHDRDFLARELRAWLPKIRCNGVVAGHDYAAAFPGVQQAIMEVLHQPPHFVFCDTSWGVVVPPTTAPNS